MNAERFVCVVWLLLQCLNTLTADSASHISYLCPSRDVVHTLVRRSRDAVHYVYSSSGCPAVLVARTHTDTRLKFDCDKFHNSTTEVGSVGFTHPPFEVMVLAFSQLIEYVDTADVADMTHYNQNTTWFGRYHLSEAFWEELKFDNNSNVLTFTATNESITNLPFLANGSLSIKFSMYDGAGYGHLLPHLAHNENTSQVDVTLDHLKPHDKQSRFGLELVVVTDSALGQNVSLSERGTLDDEHSPGSFHSVDWVMSSANKSSKAFLSWKPVSYYEAPRKVLSSEPVKHYGIRSYNFTQVSSSLQGLATAYFEQVGHPARVFANNVSFGASQDKQYYNTSQYISWTFMVGLGDPIAESFSLLVILVVAIGLGIPFLLIVVSGFYIVCKRVCVRRRGYVSLSSSYAEIN